MKRLHIHVSVKDLAASIRFYQTLFGAEPAVTKTDRAKWMLEETEQPCCYAKSDKYWVTDPTGIAWETFHTLGSIPVYGEDTAVFDHGASIVPAGSAAAQCCVPAQKATTPEKSCCAK
jgi:catechol 2,3-dioxygenase-like lactoylglutathione lyase family enzyme